MDPTWGKKRFGGCTGRPAADSRRWKQLCVIVPCVDYAQAVVQTLAVGASHTIFNVVDDEPVRYRDLFDYIATLEDAPEPRDAGPPIWSSFLPREQSAQPDHPGLAAGLCHLSLGMD
jgi:hypothetical protein